MYIIFCMFFIFSEKRSQRLNKRGSLSLAPGGWICNLPRIHAGNYLRMRSLFFVSITFDEGKPFLLSLFLFVISYKAYKPTGLFDFHIF